ncbi:hypothetical protein GOP47_0013127 [Adiantum capillus-veneris]|uniref:Uncharacterized protein n=1 Tax=Adiantum capillus-veneris TaxID=13818 RepID=A0A9D4UNM5_ADICA|nr:hypothetical protein GOP47_0013127 [Adiantum capillus-veneris]
MAKSKFSSSGAAGGIELTEYLQEVEGQPRRQKDNNERGRQNDQALNSKNCGSKPIGLAIISQKNVPKNLTPGNVFAAKLIISMMVGDL